MLGYQASKLTEKTIAGIEIMHMIKKRQVESINCVKSEVQFINQIMS